MTPSYLVSRAWPPRRVVLKLSGEMLRGNESFGLDRSRVDYLAREIRSAVQVPAQVGVVIGGGNIFRGNSEVAKGMIRAVADQVGMIATMINALLLQDALENLNLETRVMTAIEMKDVAEPYIRRRAIRHLELGRVVIFACGTGSPFFTTDTAAALRANEIEADALFKGTKVDGIFSADPNKDPKALFLPRVTYDDALARNLGVMDATALSLCRDNNMPIYVYNLSQEGNTRRILSGEEIGTRVWKE
jgi:uridylate kinase